MYHYQYRKAKLKLERLVRLTSLYFVAILQWLNGSIDIRNVSCIFCHLETSLDVCNAEIRGADI